MIWSLTGWRGGSASEKGGEEKMTDIQDEYWKGYLEAGEATPEELHKRLQESFEHERKALEELQACWSQMEKAVAAKELGPEDAEKLRKDLEEFRRELAARTVRNYAELQELNRKAQTLSREPDKPT